MHTPAFCQLLPASPELLPGSCLVQAQFDPAQLAPDDFERCAVPAVRGVSKRQAEHLAGRICARNAVWQLSGQTWLPGRDPDGVPLWPNGLTGSISHGAGLAAAVVAKTCDWRGLGIDLEQHLSVARAHKLAEQILTPSELQRASQLEHEAFAQRVTQTFSLKESLFKALFPLVRKRFYFQDAEVLKVAGEQARLRLLLDLHSDWPAGREVDGRVTAYDSHLLSLVAVPA